MNNNNRTAFALAFATLMLVSVAPINANLFTDWWYKREIQSKIKRVAPRDAILAEKQSVIDEKETRQSQRIQTAESKKFFIADQIYKNLENDLIKFMGKVFEKLDTLKFLNDNLNCNSLNNINTISELFQSVIYELTRQREQYREALAESSVVRSMDVGRNLVTPNYSCPTSPGKEDSYSQGRSLLRPTQNPVLPQSQPSYFKYPLAKSTKQRALNRPLNAAYNTSKNVATENTSQGQIAAHEEAIRAVREYNDSFNTPQRPRL